MASVSLWVPILFLGKFYLLFGHVRWSKTKKILGFLALFDGIFEILIVLFHIFITPSNFFFFLFIFSSLFYSAPQEKCESFALLIWLWLWVALHSVDGGCYNLKCPGFVQINNQIAFGAAITPLSTYNGEQRVIHVKIYKVIITIVIHGKQSSFLEDAFFLNTHYSCFCIISSSYWIFGI